MAKNITPIYCGDPDLQWVSIIGATANTATDGTGTVSNVYTAPADGGLILYIKAKPVTGSGLNNVANVARFFLNNGSSNASAINNSFFAELQLPATTGVAAAALQELVLPLNLPMKGGFKLNIALGTNTGANLGWYFTAIAGSYLIN